MPQDNELIEAALDNDKELLRCIKQLTDIVEMAAQDIQALKNRLLTLETYVGNFNINYPDNSLKWGGVDSNA
jgi:hypothetical protein